MSLKPLIEIESVCKNFGVVEALKNVSFPIYEGEILALIGENGAGKSTLAKIIAGVHSQDSGSIYYKGELLNSKSTKEAREKGIAIVLQEFALIPHLSVAENIFLTSKEMYIEVIGIVMAQKTKELFAKTRLDFNLDPNEIVENLSVAQQQYVEILKA